MRYIGISCTFEGSNSNFAKTGCATFALVSQEFYDKLMKNYFDVDTKTCENGPIIDSYHDETEYRLDIDEVDEKMIEILKNTFGDKYVVGTDLIELFLESMEDEDDEDEGEDQEL
jgi:hypothetical protein